VEKPSIEKMWAAMRIMGTDLIFLICESGANEKNEVCPLFAGYDFSSTRMPAGISFSLVATIAV
jgi:hypothetical protein